MPYTVTRQRQWPEGTAMVEVSGGGLDYTNPDALGAKYPGEFETYTDPREAVETAIAICRAWRKDDAPGARVAYGATGGMTMPFDSCSFEEARVWARRAYERLPKCARCGDPLPPHPYRLPDSDERFCREYCAEESCRQAIAEDVAA